MKMIYILLAAIVIVGICLFFFLRQPAKVNDTAEVYKPPSTEKPAEAKLDTNIYDDMKRLAYGTQYSQLNLPDAGGSEVLYGVLMDWDYDGKVTITLVAFKTGDVSLYFSMGGAIIGAGQHPEVNEASKAFIKSAQTLIAKASSTDTALTTETGVLKFYLLTNKRKYMIKDGMQGVKNQTSPLSFMFGEANKLITYVRLTQEKTDKGGGK